MSVRLAARLDAQLRDLSQRWRRCLASLLLFTIILTNNFGVSSSRTDLRSRPPPCRAGQPPSLLQCLPDPGRPGLAEHAEPASAPQLQWTNANSCCQINFYDALNCTSSHSDNRSSQDCRAHVEYLQERDKLVEMHYANFVDIMDRLDCTDTYSVIYNCSQCKVRQSSTCVDVFTTACYGEIIALVNLSYGCCMDCFIY